MLRIKRTDTTEIGKKKEKKEKEKPRADCKLAHKYIEITVLYDAWTLSTHDACSNAMRIGSIAT